MKQKITYSILAAAAACGMALGQTAYTTPVGYITIPIPSGGTVSSPKLQIASQGLLPTDAVLFAGTSDSYGSDVDGTFLADAEGTWTSDSFVDTSESPNLNNHLIEITSGPLLGTLTWITKTKAFVPEDLPDPAVPAKIYTYDDISAAGSGATYRVLKAFTISSLLGTVPASSVLGGAANAGDADNFLVFSSSSNSYGTFWYKSSGPGGTGWRSDVVAGTTAPAKTAIHPNDSALIFVRKQASVGSLVIPGLVKTGVTDVQVVGGSGTKLNILSAVFPVDQITPANSGLYTGDPNTGLKGAANAGDADNVLIFDATDNSYTTFWYKSSGPGGTGWRSDDLTIPVAADFTFPSVSGILIQRKNGTDFTWEIPQVEIAN